MLRKYFVRMMVFVVAFLSFLWAAGDMSLTLDDGREVILHEDETWGFAQLTITEGEQEDLYITLSDNRILWLKPDMTWTFTKSQPKSNKPSVYPTLAVVGVATKPSLDLAVSAATLEAYNKASASLRKYAPKSAKNADQVIAACIKNEIGENGVEIAYNPGWKAEAKINLTSFQVRKIVECIDTQFDPQSK